MANFYQGPAVLTLPENVTVDANVDLWREEDGPLVEWGGTATTNDPHRLWREEQEEQRMCTVRVGDARTGYRVGECMIIAGDDDPAVNRVTLRGSADFVEFAGE
jgi:hypothetical protein